MKKIRVELSDSYKENRAYVRKTGSTVFNEVSFTRTSTELSWGQAITVRGPQRLPLRFIPA